MADRLAISDAFVLLPVPAASLSRTMKKRRPSMKSRVGRKFQAVSNLAEVMNRE